MGAAHNDTNPDQHNRAKASTGLVWWVVYAMAAAAGMYTLYYFAFLLVAANLWVAAWLVWTKIRAQGTAAEPARRPVSLSVWAWLLANATAVVLYAPWVPVAWRQATDPPVPPWRTLPPLAAALRESWTALSLGQSAPGWSWPALLLILVVYALGVLALSRWLPAGRSGPWAAALLVLATFGSLALILIASAFTPLYNVRYVFTYSGAFYVVLGAGLAWLWRRRRAAAGLVVLAWLGAAAVTAYAFWQSPAYQTDDLRAAVRYLESHWRPGDALLVNAGYAYPALLTYWNGPVAWRGRLTDLQSGLPEETQAGSGTDTAGGAGEPGLVLASTGHVDGDPGSGLERSTLGLLCHAGGRCGAPARRAVRALSRASGSTAFTIRSTIRRASCETCWRKRAAPSTTGYSQGKPTCAYRATCRARAALLQARGLPP